MINFALNVVFKLTGRAFAAVYHVDNIMKLLTREALNGSESFVTRIGVMDGGACLVLKAAKNGITTVNNRENAAKIDLNVVFKHSGVALEVMTGRKSIVEAYADKYFYAEGPIASLTVFLEQCELLISYLLPERKAREILGYLPERTAKKSSVFKRLIFAKSL